MSDLNGDGKLDLTVANLIATVSVLFNTTPNGAVAQLLGLKRISLQATARDQDQSVT